MKQKYTEIEKDRQMHKSYGLKPEEEVKLPKSGSGFLSQEIAYLRDWNFQNYTKHSSFK